MITSPVVRRLAHQAGVSSEHALQEIVLTYALQALHERGFLKRVAFKGGTCLRKIYFGASGRISTDLDFTVVPFEGEQIDGDGLILNALECFQDPFNALQFEVGLEEKTDWWKTDGTANAVPRFTCEPGTGTIKVQISIRETPTLPVLLQPQQSQSYFASLPFKPADIPCLQLAELVSEKIRACYQRDKVRDIHDLFHLATSGPEFDEELVRKLVMLKHWQVGDSFHFGAFHAKIGSSDLDWDDVAALAGNRGLDVANVVERVRLRYRFMEKVEADDLELSRDTKIQRVDLAERMRTVCKEMNARRK
jgi:predicted nucleotidyltransferase component of viral defense system